MPLGPTLFPGWIDKKCISIATVGTRNVSMFQDRSRKMGTGRKKKRRDPFWLQIMEGFLQGSFQLWFLRAGGGVKIIFVIYSNIKSLCCLHGTKNVGQLYFKIKQTNQLVDKEIRPVVTRGKEQGELHEGGPEVQTSSYKYLGYKVQYDEYN